MFAFLSLKANSKEICEETSFPSFVRKMLTAAFLLRLKANCLENIRDYPSFSLWIPITFEQRSTLSMWSYPAAKTFKFSSHRLKFFLCFAQRFFSPV